MAKTTWDNFQRHKQAEDFFFFPPVLSIKPSVLYAELYQQPFDDSFFVNFETGSY